MGLVLRDVELGGSRADVRLAGGVIAAIGAVVPSGDDTIVDGGGGALIRGLHDHHIHLLALAAARESVQCGPPGVTSPDGLAAALRSSRADRRWVRGVGYHESVAGELDRAAMDAIVADRPVRVQHRSGALWMLNSLALTELRADTASHPGIERDRLGLPTGRLWRADSWLREQLGGAPPDLADLGLLLARMGITGCTDATPDLDRTALATLVDQTDRHALPQRLVLLGAPADFESPRAVAGPRKILLPDHELPSYDDVRAMVQQARAEGRAVAVHCVTRHSMALTVAVLDDVGMRPGDRVEHGSVVPPDLAERLADLRVRVVTQPAFIATRGDGYLRDVDAGDQPHLYPYASLLACGVDVVPSSDAPYGDVDPWLAMATAMSRRTGGGASLGSDERVAAVTVLRGYQADPLRTVADAVLAVGDSADLVLLDAPLADVLAQPAAGHVRMTLCAGVPAYQA